MQGVYLRFYVHQFQKYEGKLVYEWLLEHAKHAGYPGGSAFLSIASFGSHHKLYTQKFTELAGNLAVKVGFALSEEQASQFLDVLRQKEIEIFYVKTHAEFGCTKE